MTSTDSVSTSNTAPIRLAIIVGSVRDGRRGRAVADWYLGEIKGDPRLDIDVIDLADVPLPHRFDRESDDASVADLKRRIHQADAFVVVTPEYNHSFPAGLKDAIDYGKIEWRRKVVSFISYGGVSGGLRAVEHLRAVFAELHTVGTRETVSFHGPFNGFGDDGPGHPETAAQAVRVQLDDLLWWATTLRAGRLGG